MSAPPGSDRARRSTAAGSDRPVADGAGRPRALTAAYAFMALAAGARAVVQIATEFSAAPLAFTLSATSAAIYLLAAVALRREGPRWWTVGTAACSVELLGVLPIGTWSLLDPASSPPPPSGQASAAATAASPSPCRCSACCTSGAAGLG